MNKPLTKDQLELLASLSTPVYLPSQSSVLASEKTLWLWPTIRGDQTYIAKLRDFCSVLLSDLKLTSPSEASAINRNLAQHRYCLAVLMHSLTHIASLPYAYEALGISLNSNDYGPGKQCASLNYRAMARLVRMLTKPEIGQRLCRGRTGTFNRTTREGVRTRIWPSLDLLNRLTVGGLVWPSHPYKVRHQAKVFPVGLRATDEGDLLEVFGPLSRAEMIIPKVNLRLKTTKVAMHHPDYRSYKECWNRGDGKFKYHQAGNQLTRQFKYDLVSGGRLYGHWVQGVPEELRQFLTINGLPVVEYDFKAMQVHLAYDQLGLTCHMEDPYLIPGFAEQDRVVFKEIFKRVIGTDPGEPINVAFAVREALGAFPNKSTLDDYADAFWETHAPLRSIANTSAWRALQFKESEIALDILSTLEGKGIVCIPIHDGMIVQARNEAELSKAMETAVRSLSSKPSPRKVD